MEGEAHQACKVCGLNSDAAAEHCQHCGTELHISDLKWSRRSKS
jgi:ribosomal protein L37E